MTNEVQQASSWNETCKFRIRFKKNHLIAGEFKNTDIFKTIICISPENEWLEKKTNFWLYIIHFVCI